METVASLICEIPKKPVRKIQQRMLIWKKAPEAESINYGMPAYKTNGEAVDLFCGFQNHISLYATPSGHTHFTWMRFENTKQNKGSVQFPDEQPLPLDLIAEIIAFRVEENASKCNKKPHFAMAATKWGWLQ